MRFVDATIFATPRAATIRDTRFQRRIVLLPRPNPPVTRPPSVAVFDVLRKVIVVAMAPHKLDEPLRLTASGTRRRSQVLEIPFGFLRVDGQLDNKAIKSVTLEVSFRIH